MNNESNNTTPSTADAHDGPTSAETNTKQKYEIVLFWTQQNEARVIVEASSQDEAEEKADEIESADIDDWIPTDGELFVYSVAPVRGGQDNE